MAYEPHTPTKAAQVRPKANKAKGHGQRIANRIEVELFVGLTKDQAHALDVACEFQGLKPSVYGRGAILNRLIQEGWIKHPGFARFPELEKTDAAK
jgi:hypothetical protein